MHTRSFDPNGRLKTHRVGSDTRTLTYDAAGPVAKNYSYDAAGNPLSDGATTFTWNAAGKLATTVKSAKTHTYKTNALDQRISKNGPLSSKFFFFYDPAGQLIGEYRDNSGTATPTDDWLVRQETIWLEDIPVAVIKKATATSPILVYFIHADHLNTPRVIVNQSNTPVWRWDNTHAFGANLPNEDPDGNGQLFEYHPRFPGQYFDKETGLHYNYFRYYEPETGRYISPDPIGLVGGMNVFGYVEQNPLSFVDPTGLDVNITITRDTYTKNTVIGKINVSSTMISDTYSGNTLEDAIGGDCQCKDPISQGKYNAFIRKDHNPQTTGSGTESRILITKRKMYSSTTFSIRDLSPRFCEFFSATCHESDHP